MTTTCQAQRTSAIGDTKDDNYNRRSYGSEWPIWSVIVRFEIRDCFSANPEPKKKGKKTRSKWFKLPFSVSFTCHTATPSWKSAVPHLTLHTWHIFSVGFGTRGEMEIEYQIGLHSRKGSGMIFCAHSLLYDSSSITVKVFQ